MDAELRPQRMDVTPLGATPLGATPLGATPLVSSPLPFFAPLPVPERLHRREAGWSRALSRVLRAGANASAALFTVSLLLEHLPPALNASVTVDLLRKSGASLLLATPVVGLIGAGGALAARGEYRYAALAAGVVGLLALALCLRFSV